MNQESFTNAGEGCDAFQRQISDAADSGAPLPADVEAHLAGCSECALFAAQWLHGPPAVLLAEVSAGPVNELRERILDQHAAPRIVRFERPREGPRRVPVSTWAGRIAAGFLLAAFSYWLLNPVVAPPVTGRLPTSDVASKPTLGQSLSQLEDKSKAEREAVRTALVGGSRRVEERASWTLSALEL